MFKKFSACLCAILAISAFFYFYAVNSLPVFYKYSDRIELYEESGSFGNFSLYDGGLIKKKDIKGESCYLYGVSYEKILKDFSAKHVFSEETLAGESFYAFSPYIPYRVNLNGKIVNLQYFSYKEEKGEKVKIGTPMIFGSY